MARVFHVSCMGPIDPEWVDKEAVAALFAKLGVPKAGAAAMLAQIKSPCRLGVEGGKLAAAKKLDAELLKVGLLTQIFFTDSGAGDGKAQVYVDARQAQRRSAGEAEAKHGHEGKREHEGKRGHAKPEHAERRGRRLGDKA